MKVIKEMLISLVLAVILVAMFIGAAIQHSFRNCPPTAAELASDPSLERYLP